MARLSNKPFSSYRWTIASVDIPVTVQAGTGDHPVLTRSSGSLKGFKSGINSARMLSKIMAISANLGHSTGQELVVIAAVGNMAIQTVLIHRWMGPHERSSFFGVALVTELINGISLDLDGAETSMLFVAIRALDFSLSDRMVGGPASLCSCALVAEIAEVWLRGLQVLPGSGMNSMAVIAGKPFNLVPGQVPEG